MGGRRGFRVTGLPSVPLQSVLAGHQRGVEAGVKESVGACSGQVFGRKSTWEEENMVVGGDGRIRREGYFFILRIAHRGRNFFIGQRR